MHQRLLMIIKLIIKEKSMKLSVVLLEYHSLNEIITAVESIRKYEPDCEIVVSSNSLYNLEEQKTALESVPYAKWVFNEENGGFGYGMTMGANQASGDYIVFLNSDVILLDNFEKMIQYMDAHPNIGLIAPELIDENGVVQDSYRKTITPFNFIWRHITRLMHVEHNNKRNEPMIVDWVIGAFMLTKRSILIWSEALIIIDTLCMWRIWISVMNLNSKA